MSKKPSPNFAFLAYHDERLVALGTQAEEHFAGDPTVTLFKLRQFAEVIAQRAAARVGLLVRGEDGQQQLIDRLWERNVIRAEQRTLFHDLRRIGNAAVHEGKGDHGEALHQLKMARELAVWFQRSFGNNKKFDPGPFVPPAEPTRADAPLHEELERLRKEVVARESELRAAQRAAEEAQRAAEAQLAERLTAEQRAEKAREDAAIWEALASDEIETHRASVQAEAARSAALEEQNRKLLADPERAARLSAAVLADSAGVPDDLSENFVPLDVDERTFALRETAEREGQGAFRLRLLGAYDGRCAITGEHTEPVLDAAHIQPYLGPRSNHLQNGLILTKEFHALFDKGYVSVTPDYEIRVSDRLREEWQNGRRYYPYDKQRLLHVPNDAALKPSRDALAWHFERVFKKAG